jgi:hypothetical protein
VSYLTVLGVGMRFVDGRPEVRAYTEDALWLKWRDYSAPSAQNDGESVPEWIVRLRDELERWVMSVPTLPGGS